MPTGPEGNGLDEPTAVTARVKTFAAGDQVASADLNTIQDKIIVTSGAIDWLAGRVGVSRTCTLNQGDTPNPDTYGGGTTWIEAETSGLSIIVLDDEIDYRDRFIIVMGWVNEPANIDFPGEVGDDNEDEDLVDDKTTPGVVIHGLFYSEQGHSGSGTPTARAVGQISTGNYVSVFVRDTDGALCMKMSPWTADDGRIIAAVHFSPMQNHY